MPGGEHGYDLSKGESWKTGSSLKRANMEVYVDWLLTPESEREPRTKREMADFLEVTTQTLRNYEKDVWLQNQLATKRRRAFQVAHVDEVIATLARQAKDPENARSVAAAKLLLDWVEKQTGEMNADNMRELSDAELKAMIVEMYDKLDG